MCLSILPASMDVHNVFLVPVEVRESAWFSEIRVFDGCEPSCGCWKLKCVFFKSALNELLSRPQPCSPFFSFLFFSPLSLPSFFAFFFFFETCPHIDLKLITQLSWPASKLQLTPSFPANSAGPFRSPICLVPFLPPHTVTFTQSWSYTITHTYCDTHTLWHSHTVTVIHCHSHTLPRSHIATLTLSQSLSHTHCHTHTLLYSHSTHCHSYTLWHSYIVIFTHCHSHTMTHTVTLKHCHSNVMSQSLSHTLWHSHTVILTHCHTHCYTHTLTFTQSHTL